MLVLCACLLRALLLVSGFDSMAQHKVVDFKALRVCTIEFVCVSVCVWLIAECCGPAAPRWYRGLRFSLVLGQGTVPQQGEFADPWQSLREFKTCCEIACTCDPKF